MLTKTKSILKRLVGGKTLGCWDYLVKPELLDGWGGPFNGQIHRQGIFMELIEQLPFKAIVETGTFLGTTTEFLAKAGVPIYTVESSPRSYAYAFLRFYCRRDQVHLYEGDSVKFLRSLASRSDIPMANVLFYLDAHWEEHLPLKEELEIIFSSWRESVVLIDDFQVPGTDYGYDDYGPGNVLNTSYLEQVEHLNLSAFFPAIPASEETGKKRGCVVLSREECVTKRLSDLHSLISARQMVKS